MRLTQIICPKCKTTLTSKAGIEAGSSIACPKCKQKFDAAAPAEEVEDDFDVVDDDEEEVPAAKPASRRREQNDEDEQSPRKSKSPRGSRDDDDRPSRPKSREQDDDDRPKRKKKRKRVEEEDGAYDALKKNIWVRVSVLGVLLAVFGVLSYLLYQKMNKKDDATTVVNKDDEDDPSKPIRFRAADTSKPNGADASKSQGDTERFQGLWRATAATSDGKEYNPDGLKSLQFTVKGDRWTYQNQTDPRNGSSCKLDPSKSPAEIDFVASNHSTKHGIYRFIDKDTLEICCKRLDAGERPKQFSAPAGSNCLYMKLKREAAPALPKSKGATEVATDAERLRGTWTPLGIKSTAGGTKLASGKGVLSALVGRIEQNNGLQGIRITISDDQWTLDETEEADQFTFDSSKNPNEISLVHTDGSTSRGIAKFRDKNTLEVCFLLNGRAPKDFSPPPTATYITMTLARSQ
jgi:uncharacterized protein (TIGR03067 family)